MNDRIYGLAEMSCALVGVAVAIIVVVAVVALGAQIFTGW